MFTPKHEVHKMERIALAPLSTNNIVNETAHISNIIFEYKNLTPTPTAVAFNEDIGLFFCESEFAESFKKLGSGFFADVYRVRHSTTATFMALKVPKGTELISKFMREVRLLKRLKHENVLRFRGTCVFAGEFGCLTEYIDSGSLATLIEKQGATLEWLLSVSIAEDVAQGLQYLHRNYIVHRDLSSENILLQGMSATCGGAVTYRAVIADLGLFLDMKNPHSDRMSIVGNPFYIAPENLRSQAPYKYSSDVFSFGMILCEIITGLTNDPDRIPRTDNYGLNYKELTVKKDCPKWLHSLACDCCMVSVIHRPSMKFASKLIAENKQYIGLWTTSKAQEDSFVKSGIVAGGLKQRSLSVSMRNDSLLERQAPVNNGHLQFSIEESDDESCFVANSTATPSSLSPIFRASSVDSVCDPRLLGLQKASRDPGYVDVPLRTCMRHLDPRPPSNAARHHLHCCSESELSDARNKPPQL